MLSHVTVVGFRKALGTSITLPLEMLNAADMVQRIDHGQRKALHLQVATLDGEALTLTAGLVLQVDTCLSAIQNTDLIILPALWGNPLGVVRQQHALLDFLRAQHEQGTAICAVGTGSFFLAEAGLLDNKVGTTHWYYFDHFARRYPKVHLQRNRFITRAGQLFCAGSVNSVRDVMLYFIEEHFSPQTAHQVSRHFTHEIKRSYTSSALRGSTLYVHDDEVILGVQEWLITRHQDDIRMTEVAEHFGMSVRSLNRHFKKATGRTPSEFLLQVRIDNARELLRDTNLSISEVANSVGFSDNSYFTYQFKKSMSLAPRHYRQLVRKKQFTLDSRFS